MAIKAAKQSVTFLCEKVDLADIDIYAGQKQRTRSNVIACILKEWCISQKARQGGNNA